jgi:hypothetical protein
VNGESTRYLSYRGYFSHLRHHFDFSCHGCYGTLSLLTSSDSQEIQSFLRRPNVHYRDPNSWHRSLSSVRWIQSTSSTIFIYYFVTLILPSTHRFFGKSLSPLFSYEFCTYLSSLRLVSVPRPFQPPWLGYCGNIWIIFYISKPFFTQLFPFSRYFLTPSSKFVFNEINSWSL